jgi:hypothetical protein
VLRPLLTSIGSSYPEGANEVLRELAREIVRAKINLHRRPSLTAHPGFEEGLRSDLLWAAGKGLMPIAMPQAAVLCFRSLAAALRAGDAHRVGRSFAFVGTGLVPFLGLEAERCLRWAREMAEEQDDDHLRLMVSVAEATRHFVSGAWSSCIESCERILALAPRVRAATSWEQSMAHTLLVSGHEYRGTLRGMEEGCLRCLQALRSRGDQFTAVTVVSAYGYVRAARHDAPGLDRAIADMTSAMQDWTIGFGVWDFYHMRLRVLRALCWRDPARARELMEEVWPDLERHQLLHVPVVRGAAFVLRSSVLLGALEHASGAQLAVQAELWKLCAVLRAERRRDAQVHGEIVRAALYQHMGWTAKRDARLAQAAELAREGDLRVVTRMIERLRAGLAGRTDQRMRLENELAEAGVVNPRAWQAFVTPGFSEFCAREEPRASTSFETSAR